MITAKYLKSISDSYPQRKLEECLEYLTDLAKTGATTGTFWCDRGTVEYIMNALVEAGFTVYKVDTTGVKVYWA